MINSGTYYLQLTRYVNRSVYQMFHVKIVPFRKRVAALGTLDQL